MSERSLVVETIERPRILSDDGHKRCHERLYAVRDSRVTISHTYPQRYKGESPELQTETLSAAGALLIGLYCSKVLSLPPFCEAELRNAEASLKSRSICRY